MINGPREFLRGILYLMDRIMPINVIVPQKISNSIQITSSFFMFIKDEGAAKET
jgi:hypothetical protein